MQIKLDMKILIFLLVFYITHQIKIYALLMIFACLHEIGHLLLGLMLGFKPIMFEMKPIGFCVSFQDPIADYSKKILKANRVALKKIFVYLAGPVVNLIIVILMLTLNINMQTKIEIIYINLIIAFVNFLPIYPLDGGRILKSILYIFFGIKKSYKIVEKISWVTTIIILGVSSVLILEVKNGGLLLLIIYLLIVRAKETKIIKNKLMVYELIKDERISRERY